MRLFTVDFPQETMPPGVIPEKLLKLGTSIKFIRLDFNGFLFSGHLQESAVRDTISFLKKHYRQVQKGKVKVTHEGQGIILVSGGWSKDGQFLWNDDKGYLLREKEFAELMGIYQSRACFLRSPEIVGNCLRFVLVGETDTLKTFENMLCKVSLPYHVRKISGFVKSVDSAFDRLTTQQMRILRLAYSEGYYDVPRKISTEELAKLLKMEKGNVGEHLRRAEKNIMDFLMMT
jgi:hypothetical protein